MIPCNYLASLETALDSIIYAYYLQFWKSGVAERREGGVVMGLKPSLSLPRGA